jgi:hypothetical protein
MELLKVKCTDCSNEYVLKIAQECGFTVYHGAKHDKIKTSDGKFIATVPRSKHIKKPTARGIFNAFQDAGAEIAIIK